MSVMSTHVADVKTIETLFDIRPCGKKIKRLLYDQAADADWLRDSMEEGGVKLIRPHRRGWKRQPLAACSAKHVN